MQIFKKDQPYGHGDSTYKAVGEYDGLVKLVDHFYDAMGCLPQASKIRAMHRSDLTNSRVKLVHFLSGWMGGPQIYAEKFGGIDIPQAHAHLLIDESDRDAWLGCMQVALSELDYPQDFQDYLMAQLFRPAERIRQVSQENHPSTF